MLLQFNLKSKNMKNQNTKAVLTSIASLVGKEFVYQSKYGGYTVGTIEDVWNITQSYNPIGEYFSFKWELNIKSTNGIVYKLSEISIINTPKNLKKYLAI